MHLGMLGHLKMLGDFAQLFWTMDALLVSFKKPAINAYISFVYGANDICNRMELWNFITDAAVASHHIPWCMVGDFNAVHNLGEQCGGNLEWISIDTELGACCNRVELEDLHFSGNFFTWSSKQCFKPILRKPDWILVNAKRLETQGSLEANFLPPGISDHSSCVIRLPIGCRRRKIPYNFFNYWTSHPSYATILNSA